MKKPKRQSKVSDTLLKRFIEEGKSIKEMAFHFNCSESLIKVHTKRLGGIYKPVSEIKKEVEIQIQKLKAAEAFSNAEKHIQENYSLIQNLFDNLGTLNGQLQLNKNRIIVNPRNKDDKQHQELLLKTIDSISKTATTLVSLREQLLGEEEIRVFKEAMLNFLASKSPDFKKEIIDEINRIRFSRSVDGINSRDTSQSSDRAIPAGDTIPNTPEQNKRVVEDKGFLQGREPGGRFGIL